MQLVHLVYNVLLAERFSDRETSKNLLRSAMRCGQDLARAIGGTHICFQLFLYFNDGAPHLICNAAAPMQPEMPAVSKLIAALCAPWCWWPR